MRWIAVFGVMWSFAAQAQVAPEKPVLPFPRYKQMQGILDADGFPTSGAKLCLLSAPDTCFTMPSHPMSEGEAKNPYQFGLEPKSERLALANGGSLIFFTGTFSGGGSGTLERLALLRYGAGGTISNLLPYVAMASQGQRAMWGIPGASPYPVLVMANFIWGTGETRWDRHFYTVEAWRFDPATGAYAQAFSYRTAKSYESGDSRPVRVLAGERAEIQRQLGVTPVP